MTDDIDPYARTSPVPPRDVAPHAVHAGRGIVVTGAAGGIGFATAELLIAQGARVVLADIQADAILEAARRLGGADAGAYALTMNVASPESIDAGTDAARQLLGGIDGWVNNAAILRYADPLNTTREQWTAQLDVNLIGTYNGVRAAARAMIADGIPGAIVSVASDSGKDGYPDTVAYGATKSGVIGLTRSMSKALAVHDINVNCVCPDKVETDMYKSVAGMMAERSENGVDEVFATMTSSQLGRHLRPVEIARVISFLLSDEALVIRGQAINADAGETPY